MNSIFVFQIRVKFQNKFCFTRKCKTHHLKFLYTAEIIRIIPFLWHTFQVLRSSHCQDHQFFAILLKLVFGSQPPLELIYIHFHVLCCTMNSLFQQKFLKLENSLRYGFLKKKNKKPKCFGSKEVQNVRIKIYVFAVNNMFWKSCNFPGRKFEQIR